MIDLALRRRPGRLDRARLEVAAPEAAVALLGALLVRDPDDGEAERGGGDAVGGQVGIARIVEVEAYREDDPASHSFPGRTDRSEPMFRRPGTAYVYRSYGVHWCLNVTVEPEGIGAAVLLRAAAVLEGHAGIRSRRHPSTSDRDLLRGPGRLTTGLDIDRARHDCGDLLDGVEGLWLGDDGWRPPRDGVVAGPRVGVRTASRVPWRFHLQGVPEVSPYRRHPRAPVAR